MFPGARVLQLSYNEARVCTTVRRAKQRVYRSLAKTAYFRFHDALPSVLLLLLFSSFSYHINRKPLNENAGAHLQQQGIVAC